MTPPIGLSPISIGSDVAISVRGPAAFTGIAALKATHGRIPYTGHFPAALSRYWHVGPMARTICDVALGYSILKGADGVDPYAVHAKDAEPADPRIDGQTIRVGWVSEAAFGPSIPKSPPPSQPPRLGSRVTAIEFDAELAARARANLAQAPHVRAVHGDGTRAMFEPADVIYVNAGATRPADAWLDRLKEGGRLILPLTADGFPNRDVRRGIVFRFKRRGPEFFARRISGVAIFPCEGGRDEVSEQALAAAFDKGGAERVTRLYWHGDLPEDQCWLRAPGWCLASR